MTLDDFVYPFEFFSRNYLAAVILAAVCAYVGLFVVLRRIVFVGVALAELSVLGLAAAFLALTFLPQGPLYDLVAEYGPTAGAVAFALGGVALLALGAVGRKLPRDGLIGLAFAAASAVALLFVWKSAFGKEELESIVSGSILFVSDARLLVLFASYLGVALLHALLFKEFLFVSFDREMATTLGLRAGRYDFLLYASIAVVISIGVRICGVLQVFGYLVIPPIGGLLLADGFAAAARIAIAQALVGSCAGLFLAYHFGYPVGPMIVACLAGEALLAAAARRFSRLRKPFRLAARVLAVPAAASLLVAAANFLGGTQLAHEPDRRPPVAAESDDSLVAHLVEHDLASASADTRAHAVEELGRYESGRAAEAIRRALGDSDPTVQLAAIEAVAARRDALAEPALEGLVASPGLPRDVELAAADALASLGSAKAVASWLALLEAEGEPVIRSDAHARLADLLRDDAGYDPALEPAENAAAIDRLRSLAEKLAPRIVFDPSKGRLELRQ